MVIDYPSKPQFSIEKQGKNMPLIHIVGAVVRSQRSAKYAKVVVLQLHILGTNAS